MQSELKPCPLCQSKNVTDWTMVGGYWEVPKRCGLVRCQDCGCHAPTTAWNTRASDAERREPDANENPYSRARLNSENTKLRAEITRLTEALRAAEEREKGLREALVRKARSTMIAELAGLPMESQYRAGIKWCGERIQDALKGPSHD